MYFMNITKIFEKLIQKKNQLIFDEDESIEYQFNRIKTINYSNIFMIFIKYTFIIKHFVILILSNLFQTFSM